MTGYARAWESYLQKFFEEECQCDGICEQHLIKIQWLQHERLVHLLVLLSVIFSALMVGFLSLRYDSILLSILLIILIVLTAFYIWHYYFLENTVQRWYRYYDRLIDMNRTNTEEMEGAK